MIKIKLLADQALLEKQLEWLRYSYEECKAIGLKDVYAKDEYGKFETMCSRYSRSIDFLVRKIFRTIDEYEFENQGTLIDVVNNAHKRGLIEDINQFRLMKDVRNSIAHEYIDDELLNTFDEVLEYTAVLDSIINRTLLYIKNAVN